MMLEKNNDATSTQKILHSVCRWCYDSIPLEDFCIAAKAMGIKSVELLDTADFPVLERHGLDCAMVTFPTGETQDGTKVGMIEKAFSRLEHHDTLEEIYTKKLHECAAVGAKRLICFSGNREGMDDAQGLDNCAVGLQRILPLAEELGIILVMELLNSKVDHPDYMCDHTAWGVALAERLSSPNFGLLYDIYHMQVMEGDVIATIRANHRHFSHYHTGGVPGRNEIGTSQELNYPAIMRAILETGYNGYVGQEFIPTGADKLASLRQGIGICTV
ncbi:MAG: TIM barrel protein [Luteolibacter sp.]